MHAPAAAARGLKDRDDTRDLSDQELERRARRCQDEQARRLAAVRAASGGGQEPLRKAR